MSTTNWNDWLKPVNQKLIATTQSASHPITQKTTTKQRSTTNWHYWPGPAKHKRITTQSATESPVSKQTTTTHWYFWPRVSQTAITKSVPTKITKTETSSQNIQSSNDDDWSLTVMYSAWSIFTAIGFTSGVVITIIAITSIFLGQRYCRSRASNSVHPSVTDVEAQHSTLERRTSNRATTDGANSQNEANDVTSQNEPTYDGEGYLVPRSNPTHAYDEPSIENSNYTYDPASKFIWNTEFRSPSSFSKSGSIFINPTSAQASVHFNPDSPQVNFARNNHTVFFFYVLTTFLYSTYDS